MMWLLLRRKGESKLRPYLKNCNVLIVRNNNLIMKTTFEDKLRQIHTCPMKSNQDGERSGICILGAQPEVPV